MPRSRWTVAVLGGLSAALLVPSLALAAPSQSNVTVYATGGPATATVTGGPITGLGDDAQGHPLNPCPPSACESFGITLVAPGGYTATNQINLSVSVAYPGTLGGTLDTYLEDSGGNILGADPNSNNPSVAADSDAAPGNYVVIIAGSVGANDTYTATVTASSSPRAQVVLPPLSTTISFGVPSVMDPIHPFGEPSIGVSRIGDVFASGPTGTGTQRSAWEVSKDGGYTYRVINQMTPPNAVQSINAPPGGGDTDLAFDNRPQQGHYFSDLYALACLRNEKTTDEGATTSEAYSTSLNLVRPTVYQEYGPTSFQAWVKSPDGLNYTSADGGNSHFGADGYPAIDQVTGKVFEATYSGSTIKLNIGTPNDAAGDLTFLDDTGGPGLITVANGVINSGDVANFVVSSMDAARNLYVTWVGRSTIASQRQVFVAASSPSTGWTQWTAPVQVSDGLASTGDAVNVFPWIKAGGSGMADAVWYGDSSSLDPSSTSSGHVWNVFMNQLAFPTNTDGTINYNAPTTQVLKVTPHPMDYEDVCLSGTGCITNMPPGNRNLADFFSVTMDNTGAAEIIYDDMSNGLIQQPFATSNSADHAGAALVMVIRQNAGTGLLGTPVGGPSAAPIAGQTDPSADALFSVTSGAVTGTNHTSLDFLSNQLSLSGNTLTVTMKVVDLTGATLAADMASIPGTAFQQYVTRWQMGNTIYYAMMETNGAQRSTNTDQYFAGAAQSIDLCSVSACDPHVLYYPEAGTTAHNETGTVSCPATPSVSSPCTITITVNRVDVGTPTVSSLLEEVGSYAFASSHLQASIDNAQAQADNVPLEVDGICCFNFQANNLVSVPEVPWVPALPLVGAALVAAGIARRRRRDKGPRHIA
ncbi:MAG: hypothetical protein E6J45_12390 [Chloroflexi bacterium]|nr:MAG: hypothetical protein E6J45_12390 [Chloroflexota bacterium]